jgi:hypothetical protein
MKILVVERFGQLTVQVHKEVDRAVLAIEVRSHGIHLLQRVEDRVSHRERAIDRILGVVDHAIGVDMG